MKRTVVIFVAVMAAFAAATGGVVGGEGTSAGRLGDTEAVDDLDEPFKQSVAEKGVLEPLVVTNGKEIISGHRRWLAARDAGLVVEPRHGQVVRFGTSLLDALGRGLRHGVKCVFITFPYFFFLMPVFGAALVGGIGNPYGAMLGALVIGLAENLILGTDFGVLLGLGGLFDVGEVLVPTGYKPAVSFVAIILVLLFRPAGLLGRR